MCKYSRMDSSVCTPQPILAIYLLPIYHTALPFQRKAAPSGGCTSVCSTWAVSLSQSWASLSGRASSFGAWSSCSSCVGGRGSIFTMWHSMASSGSLIFPSAGEHRHLLRTCNVGRDTGTVMVECMSASLQSTYIANNGRGMCRISHQA